MSTQHARQCRHLVHVSMQRLTRSPGITTRTEEPKHRPHMGTVRTVPPIHLGLSHLRRA